jgi:hypothetical protein
MRKPFPQQSRVRKAAGYQAEDFEPHPVSSLLAFPLYLLAMRKGLPLQRGRRNRGFGR